MNARLMMSAATIAIVAIVAIMVGCGSDSSGESGSEARAGSTAADASSLTKEEFVKQANSICYKERLGSFARLAAYGKKHRSEGLSEEELAEGAAKAALLSTINAEAASLRQLGASVEDNGEFESILATFQADLDQVNERKAKLSSTEIEDYFADSDKQLLSYGLTECVKNG